MDSILIPLFIIACTDIKPYEECMKSASADSNWLEKIDFDSYQWLNNFERKCNYGPYALNELIDDLEIKKSCHSRSIPDWKFTSESHDKILELIPESLSRNVKEIVCQRCLIRKIISKLKQPHTDILEIVSLSFTLSEVLDELHACKKKSSIKDPNTVFEAIIRSALAQNPSSNNYSLAINLTEPDFFESVQIVYLGKIILKADVSLSIPAQKLCYYDTNGALQEKSFKRLLNQIGPLRKEVESRFAFRMGKGLMKSIPTSSLDETFIPTTDVGTQ